MKLRFTSLMSSCWVLITTTTSTTAATATTTNHLLEELVLGGEMQNILLVALLSLRARLRARYENWK